MTQVADNFSSNLFFVDYPEDGGSNFPRKFRNKLPINT
jgi:hypothetical protein